uniref:Myozenin 2b n=1 Tax=Sinocyclocheilus grahami TaxID=75366 RepID=A0A672P8N7_SINGR
QTTFNTKVQFGRIKHYNENQANAENSQQLASKTPPNTPDPRNPANPQDIAPGMSKINNVCNAQKCHYNNCVLEQILFQNLIKSLFLRVATPFGGFEKAPRGITFKLPEVDLNAPRYPELQDPTAKRPTFNRTAQGWISDGMPLILPTVSLEPFEIPESDDL